MDRGTLRLICTLHCYIPYLMLGTTPHLSHFGLFGRQVRSCTSIDSDRVFFHLPFLVDPKICALFWGTYSRFSSSGQNDPSRWGSFSDGDTLLDYWFAMFHNHNLILELANPEIGVRRTG